MSQTNQEERAESKTASVAEAPHVTAQRLGQSYHEVISAEARIYTYLVMVFLLLLMAGAALLGATWVFAPVYVGVAITYVAGALYLFKKLMTF